MTIDTTSTGMPPITPAHDALDQGPAPGASHGASLSGAAAPAVQSLLGEGKAQISSSLGGLADAVREIAAKLEGNGESPIARYVHDAADTVKSWSHNVDNKSVDDLMGDARTLVRTSPALAVGIAVAAGFVVSRLVRSAR